MAAGDGITKEYRIEERPGALSVRKFRVVLKLSNGMRAILGAYESEAAAQKAIDREKARDHAEA